MGNEYCGRTCRDLGTPQSASTLRSAASGEAGNQPTLDANLQKPAVLEPSLRKGSLDRKSSLERRLSKRSMSRIVEEDHDHDPTQFQGLAFQKQDALSVKSDTRGTDDSPGLELEPWSSGDDAVDVHRLDLEDRSDKLNMTIQSGLTIQSASSTGSPSSALEKYTHSEAGKVHFDLDSYEDSEDEYSSADGSSLPSGQLDTVDINKPGIIPSLTFICLWVGASSALLLAIVWVYAYEEIRKHEDLATEVAVAHARLHAAEVLAPAVAVVSAVNLAFKGHTIHSLGDYRGLMRILTPHFEARAWIREVELAAAPQSHLGSVHMASKAGGGIELRTDRPDCSLVDGRRGCAVDLLDANASSWYVTGFGVGNEWWKEAPSKFWEGPAFARENPHEVVCGDLCWLPTYAFVGMVPFGAAYANMSSVVEGSGVGVKVLDEVPLSPPVPKILVRAAMDATALQEVAVKAEELSRGEVMLCTSEGNLLAASDMADAIRVDAVSGLVQAAKVWEIDRPWASGITAAWIDKARADSSFVNDRYRISVWPLGGSRDATRSLGENLRVVLAVRGDAFLDSVLGPLLPWSIATGTTPAIILVLFTLLAAYFKCCHRRPSLSPGDVGPVPAPRTTSTHSST